MKKCPACGKQYEDANTLCPADGAVLKKADGERDALIGQVLHGKYRIEEKIDEGGMGCVYRATHVLMEKTVAIKVLHAALAADDKIVMRFTREARAASRISHPHAINVTDFGESENGVVYLVMEYLRGRTLKDVVRGEGPLPLARAVEIVRQVSGALEAAHAEGVVHRDLKSDNIMLEEASGGGDWAKVLDFGIAKIQQDVDKTDPGLTAPNIIIGTPQYMSPEQCGQASAIDARSDIYSFGVILFEMLAGHVPFTGESPTAIMMKHLQEPPPSILDERKDLPAGVARVIARALAKRPEDRFQKAGELADALAKAAADEAPADAALLAHDTERIVVPTSPFEPPRTTASEEGDEATVVRARRDTVVEEELPPPVAPVPIESFNPWRIAVPAIAALAIIFAVVFAFQRRDSAAEAQPEQPFTSDPNSQPVQPVTPPTGQAEQNLAVPAGTPTVGSGADGTGGLPATTDSNANTSVVSAPSPTPAEGGNSNAGQEDAEEGEEEQPEPEPTPTPARNKRLPNVNINSGGGEDDDAPPPPPKPRPKATPKLVDTVKPGGEGPRVPDDQQK